MLNKIRNCKNNIMELEKFIRRLKIFKKPLRMNKTKKNKVIIIRAI